MSNKQAVLATAGVVLALVLIGGGFWLGRHHASKQPVSSDASSTVDDNSPSSSGGLSVSGGSATSLGQLGGGSQNGSSTTGQTNDSSSGSSSIDPSTFAQYDKYKDNSTALFGDIQVGSGATLGANQKATITYKGWLTDGTLFDASKTDSSGQLQPFSFTLGANQVIGGLEEGVAGMKVGGSRLIIVPPALGYGASGQGSIPANALLIFEVNLLDVN